MDCFLIAAITADGFIGRTSAQASLEWTSKEDTDFFKQKTKDAGVVVVGSNTYKTIGKPLRDRLTIVYTRNPNDFAGHEIETTTEEPAQLLLNLKNRGYSKVAVIGGASIYTLFIKAKVVNTVYLTVEPVLFGNGIKLFTEELDAKLNLKKTKKLNENAVLLEYNVSKE